MPESEKCYGLAAHLDEKEGLADLVAELSGLGPCATASAREGGGRIGLSIVPLNVPLGTVFDVKNTQH